jgi:hypothetical protein
MATINAAVDGIILTADSSATLSLATSGVIRATIDPTGNIGIGTTTASFKITNNFDAPATWGNNANNFIEMWQNSGTNALGVAMGDDSIASLTTNNGYNLVLATDGVERVRVATSTGNVGIGKTAAAGRLLDVNGDAWFNGVRVGRGAGSASTNTAVGSNALTANTSGTVNTAVGEGALASNTTGSGNNAFGRNALTGNTTGYGNVAVGSNDAGTLAPMQLNTTGYYNVAIGNGALYANTSGNNNTAVGRSALFSNTTGSINTAIGGNALNANTTGYGGVAVGIGALQSNTTGYYNTALGANALFSNTTGLVNVAIGHAALYNCNSSFNIAIGYYSLVNVTSGQSNTVIGYYSGATTTTGGANVFLGEQAGYYAVGNTTGSYNTILGSFSYQAAATDNYEIVIGYNTQGKGSSTGFINPNGGGVYQGNNSSSWSTTSDRRLKKNIVDNNEGLAKINQLRVRNFEYRTEDEVDPELPKTAAIKVPGVQLGVIAQEIQEVLPECVKQESTGVMSVDSDRLIWHLVNAVKELSAEVNALKAKLE